MGMKWERWAPGAGILFVLAYIVAFAIGGDPPKADDSVGTIRDYYADDGAILTSTYIFGIAVVFYLSFVGTLASRLREAGQRRLAAVAFAGALTVAGIAIIGTLAGAVLAYRTPADDSVLQAFYDVQLLAYVLVSFPAAALFAATAIASERAGVFPRWLNASSGVAAVAFLVGGATFASSGFFAPNGVYAVIMTIVFMAWVVASSALMLRQPQAVEAPQAVAAPM